MEEDKKEWRKSPTEKKRGKKFSKRNLESVKASYENRGIVYIGRIPPRMDFKICRRILTQYGEIGRIHFANEDLEVFKERKEAGGYKRRGYCEGWVEFMDKQIAKKFVRRLNGQPIGGKKRNPFYEELWCIKYLPKFKWDHLLEGMRYRKMLYQQEVQQELADAKKQQETYLNRVQAARRLEKANKMDESQDEDQPSVYTQIPPLPDPVEDASTAELSNDLLSLFAGHPFHKH